MTAGRRSRSRKRTARIARTAEAAMPQIVAPQVGIRTVRSGIVERDAIPRPVRGPRDERLAAAARGRTCPAARPARPVRLHEHRPEHALALYLAHGCGPAARLRCRPSQDRADDCGSW